MKIKRSRPSDLLYKCPKNGFITQKRATRGHEAMFLYDLLLTRFLVRKYVVTLPVFSSKEVFLKTLQRKASFP